MCDSDKEIKLHARFIKSYKKNTLAIFFSFALTFMLLTVMLVMLHTNFRIQNLQLKTEFTPSDCYIDGLTMQQLDRLRKDPEIERIAVQQGGYKIFERNNQNVFLYKNDDAAITMMAIVVEGRLPEKEGEIVAEKWTLLNLSIEPVVNQTIKITDSDTGEEKKFKLVGILSDIYGNKKHGLLSLYTVLGQKTDESYLAYLQFKSSVRYSQKAAELPAELGIAAKQIKDCPARENFSELYFLEIEIICVILLICIVVFYGIYRIAVISRLGQYGILRAVGMKRRQLQKMLLMELYEIYIVSVPVGILIGMLAAYFVLLISGDRDKEIYLNNEAVNFHLMVPGGSILFCVVIIALLVGMIGYMVGKRVTRFSITETISGSLDSKKDRKSCFRLQRANGKTGMLLHMGLKYIFRDMKTSVFAILTICLGVTLFTGLSYQAKIMRIYREDTREMYYLNGQYAITMQYFDQADQGISRGSAEEMQKFDEITAAKTSSGIPIRVIDEEGVGRKEAYYDDHNKRLQENYGYCDAGYDGKNQIYKSVLYGYNVNALKALKQYVSEGEFQPENIGEDEVILCVMRMDDTKDSNIPGSYKEGSPLMQYQAGDEISVKYRADLQTGLLEYATLADHDAEYVYRSYKIAAIVSFPYMYDCKRTVYPLLITDDRYIQQMAPDSRFQCMYIDGSKNMSLPEQVTFERKLIQAASQNSNVSTRSLISEIEQNEMFYQKQMVYIYGIAIVAFFLVLINMMNNLQYRMQTRTREICMLRAVGLSVSMAKKMLLFENTILGLTAVVLAFGLSQPTLRYLYFMSDMRAFGHDFHFDFMAFAIVAVFALLLCSALSFKILKEWKTRRIAERIREM